MSASQSCWHCRDDAATSGALCARCQATLPRDPALCPEQIVSTLSEAAEFALIDRWGRVHLGRSGTVIGRRQDFDGVTIMDGDVSRHHAKIMRGVGVDAWLVVDLGSTNGTQVNGVAVGDSCPVAYGDVLGVASVSFYVERAQVLASRAPIQIPTRRTEPLRGEFGPADVTAVASVPRLDLSRTNVGNGGVATLGGTTVHLTQSQYDLLELMTRRTQADRDRSPAVCGFVSTSEIIETVSWDTAYPDDSNVKQLVRRLRRTFQRAGLEDPVESRPGFGYRLKPLG